MSSFDAICIQRKTLVMIKGCLPGTRRSEFMPVVYCISVSPGNIRDFGYPDSGHLNKYAGNRHPLINIDLINFMQIQLCSDN